MRPELEQYWAKIVNEARRDHRSKQPDNTIWYQLVLALDKERKAAKKALEYTDRYDKNFPHVLSGDVPPALGMIPRLVRKALED